MLSTAVSEDTQKAIEEIKKFSPEDCFIAQEVEEIPGESRDLYGV